MQVVTQPASRNSFALIYVACMTSYGCQEVPEQYGLEWQTHDLLLLLKYAVRAHTNRQTSAMHTGLLAYF